MCEKCKAEKVTRESCGASANSAATLELASPFPRRDLKQIRQWHSYTRYVKGRVRKLRRSKAVQAGKALFLGSREIRYRCQSGGKYDEPRLSVENPISRVLHRSAL